MCHIRLLLIYLELYLSGYELGGRMILNWLCILLLAGGREKKSHLAEMIVNSWEGAKTHKAEIIFYNVAANGNNGVIFTIPVPNANRSALTSHLCSTLKI